MGLTAYQLGRLRQAGFATAGNRVAAAMALLDVTQTAVAEATGLSQGYISDVCNGRQNTVTVESAHKFATFFECSIEDLFPSREAVAS